MKKLIAVLMISSALAVPAAALAFGASNDRTITVPKGETRAGTYYAMGQTITIDGDIDGDLVCAGNTVAVNGTVRGDVLCAAQTITVSGAVDGNVRVAGQVVNLNSSIGRNAMVATQSLNLGKDSKVSGDLGLLAQMAGIDGIVTKDVYGMVDSLALAGTVGTTNVTVTDLRLEQGAKVEGDLHYTTNGSFSVDRNKVAGDVKRSAAGGPTPDDAARSQLALRLYWMAASLVVGLAFVLLAPRLLKRVTATMREKPSRSIGWGLVLVLLAPILAFLLMLTILGVPLGLLVIAVWILLVSTSGIVAGIAAGEWFVERAEWRRQPLLTAAVIGIPLAVIFFSIPVLGWLVGMVATWWAVGGVVLMAQKARA